MIEISLGTATRRLTTFRHVAHVTFTLSLSVGGCAVKQEITGKVLLIAFTGLRPEQRGLLVHYICVNAFGQCLICKVGGPGAQRGGVDPATQNEGWR